MLRRGENPIGEEHQKRRRGFCLRSKGEKEYKASMGDFPRYHLPFSDDRGEGLSVWCLSLYFFYLIKY